MVTGKGERVSDLYVREYLPLVRLARLLTGSDHLSEDLVQEAFTRLPSNPLPTNPGGYLRTIVVNLARDHHRRRYLIQRTRLPVPASTLIPEVDETYVALQRLPAEQRAVVVLRFYADMSEQEIATALGCKLGTVKSRLHRALGTLRKELQ